VFLATSYNGEIEVTGNSRREIGEFGPLGYVFLIVTVACFTACDDRCTYGWAPS
jgi:hypothetical protein